MCKCTPEIRTPFCGRGDCLPPANREQDMEREFAAQASLDRLWAQAVRQSEGNAEPVPSEGRTVGPDRYAELLWKLSDIAYNSSISVPLGMRAEDHYRDQLRRCIAIAAQALSEEESQ